MINVDKSVFVKYTLEEWQQIQWDKRKLLEKAFEAGIQAHFEAHHLETFEAREVYRNEFKKKWFEENVK